MSETPSVFGPRNLPSVRSAIQFADLTNNGPKGQRGATMNPYTYKVAEVGVDPMHAVGGARNAEGTDRIPTTYIDPGKDNPKITPADVLKMAGSVKAASGNNPKVHLGSWVEDRTKKSRAVGVQMDAVDILPADTHPDVIRKMLKERNEKASFNISDPDKSVRNWSWRKYNGQN